MDGWTLKASLPLCKEFVIFKKDSEGNLYAAEFLNRDEFSRYDLSLVGHFVCFGDFTQVYFNYEPKAYYDSLED